MSEPNEVDDVPAEVEAEFDAALEQEASEWEAATLKAMQEDGEEEGDDE